MGSSPLTRGKSSTTENSSSATGLIPAHAGKIGRKAAAGLSCRAHPRSRGENHPLDGDKIARPGSSPLTRGKYGGELGVGRGGGLIPAHAGKIRNGASPASHAWAHPRSRGENAELGFTKVGGSGSSPLTRGKSPTTNVLAIERGSSPLTRGKFVLVDQVPQILGLIPAHAGKICSAGTTLVWNQAHPRSRGENYNDAPHALAVEGSSPLTRGKYERERRGLLRFGLIPAHAGKIAGTACDGRRGRAHPRSRGENAIDRKRAIAVRGSSPLTRGKCELNKSQPRKSGLIPAHAGKISPPS